MTTAKVQISVSLLEKLAGIKKEPHQRQQQHAPPGLPLQLGLPVLPRELAAPFNPAAAAADGSVQQQIKQSRRVGEFLLQHEEQEMALVNQRAGELIKQYSVVSRALPCQAEEQACTECYKQHPGDVLQCAQLVAAYTACAQQASGQLMS